ncbi:ATP-grasp domain-containing protein [Actinokineospora auranticolor]|uniref:ATP-grasp domain-containing protein n=1 Tax=Actinokineospora auranticolor TaxID=155976 RepID=A0A2S6H127_9PSEU|nr:ATP-grasp domain-containing protein [Actinokineospora auranticolor]
MAVHAIETADRAAALTGEVEHLTIAAGDTDEAWAAAAFDAAARRRPDGVLAFAEQHVLAAALVADELGLPGPSLRASAISRDKALQRGRFAVAGVRQPEHLITGRLADAADWAASRYPVVVKAVSRTGSDGVESVADADAFADAAARRAGESPLLVESMVEGPEYSWEALVRDGEVLCANVTAKETTGPPRFIETGHRTGVLLDPAESAAVEDLAARVLTGLGMRTGIVHLEYRVAADGPTLMEVAVRTPGDFLMDLICLSHDRDWFELVVRLSLGMPVLEAQPRTPTPAAGYFPLTDPGVVTAIEGLDEVRAHPTVDRAGVLVDIGDTVPPAVSSMQRRIFVLFTGPDLPTLDKALDFTRHTLAVRTRPL